MSEYKRQRNFFTYNVFVPKRLDKCKNKAFNLMLCIHTNAEMYENAQSCENRIAQMHIAQSHACPPCIYWTCDAAMVL